MTLFRFKNSSTIVQRQYYLTLLGMTFVYRNAWPMYVQSAANPSIMVNWSIGGYPECWRTRAMEARRSGWPWMLGMRRLGLRANKVRTIWQFRWTFRPGK